MCLSTKATSNNELSNNRQKNFFSYFECLSKRKKKKEKDFCVIFSVCSDPVLTIFDHVH